VLAAFTDIRDRHQVGTWVITDKVEGQFMGHFALVYREATDEHELGYVPAKAFWGHGYATEAVRAMARYGFEQAHLHRIVAATQPGNVASRRVLEHVGFVYERDVNYSEMTGDTTAELPSPMTTYYALTPAHFVPGDSGDLRLHDAPSSWAPISKQMVACRIPTGHCERPQTVPEGRLGYTAQAPTTPRSTTSLAHS
jgi:hypothetical protein